MVELKRKKFVSITAICRTRPIMLSWWMLLASEDVQQSLVVEQIELS